MGGGGKIPVMPNYLISMSDHKIILRNYEGYITTYEEPTDYILSDAAKFKGEKRMEPGFAVLGLLDMIKCSSKPESFDEIHDYYGIQHRLKDEKNGSRLPATVRQPPMRNKQTKVSNSMANHTKRILFTAFSVIFLLSACSAASAIHTQPGGYCESSGDLGRVDRLCRASADASRSADRDEHHASYADRGRSSLADSSHPFGDGVRAGCANPNYRSRRRRIVVVAAGVEAARLFPPRRMTAP
ncbi:MAG: hypothetical protein U0X93_17300 [Anaerolineales bacterium]